MAHGQSVCLGVRHPTRVLEEIFVTVRQLMVCRCGELNLTRGRVCSLHSVFVFSLRAAFGCVFNLKTLKVHNMFRSLRPSSGVKIVNKQNPTDTQDRTIKQTNMGNEP
jgi:hypothetical protein